MGHSCYDLTASERRAWNAGKKVGTKRPLKPRQVWAIRFFLDRERRLRDRALFDLAIDSKLRGCDLVKIKIGNLVVGPEIRTRAMVIQQKTGRPVQFELMIDARSSLLAWLERRGGTVDDYAFPSRIDPRAHMSTRQYARLVDEWVEAIGLRPPGIRHSFPASHQGVDYLQSDGKSSSYPDPARSYQDREHGPLSGSRCRRCSRTCRGN
jgi:integrase